MVWQQVARCKTTAEFSCPALDCSGRLWRGILDKIQDVLYLFFRRTCSGRFPGEWFLVSEQRKEDRAGSIMSRGYAEYGVCAGPLCISVNTQINDIVNTLYRARMSILERDYLSKEGVTTWNDQG
jgi:hypothetical protein